MSNKLLHTLVLDSGPILRDDPSLDTITARAENIVTSPSVISEIKDANARRRIDLKLLPFMKLQAPSPASLDFITTFAKKTGDLSTLSRTDVGIIALTYEIEREHNESGSLRQAPGQRLRRPDNAKQAEKRAETDHSLRTSLQEEKDVRRIEERSSSTNHNDNSLEPGLDADQREDRDVTSNLENLHVDTCHERDNQSNSQEGSEIVPTNQSSTQSTQQLESDGDSDDWITPSNLRKHQEKDMHGSTVPLAQESGMQVACITTDYAMQNVLLQIGLNLLSPSLQRIKNIKTYILRCHACFEQVRDTSKQFCPRCGNPTLTRVSCSTNSKGEFRIHLKKKMEWHHRGDRYSIPKPVHGSASGKTAHSKGGGKGGWGQRLILTEDQKEYRRATNGNVTKAQDLMDEDYLPGILTGNRNQAGSRSKVGAGKNVNSRKRVA